MGIENKDIIYCNNIKGECLYEIFITKINLNINNILENDDFLEIRKSKEHIMFKIKGVKGKGKKYTKGYLHTNLKNNKISFSGMRIKPKYRQQKLSHFLIEYFIKYSIKNNLFIDKTTKQIKPLVSLLLKKHNFYNIQKTGIEIQIYKSKEKEYCYIYSDDKHKNLLKYIKYLENNKEYKIVEKKPINALYIGTTYIGTRFSYKKAD